MFDQLYIVKLGRCKVDSEIEKGEIDQKTDWKTYAAVVVKAMTLSGRRGSSGEIP